MTTPLGQPIAVGRTAEIYAWENDQVLKLFFADVPRTDVEREAQISRQIYASFVPSPAVGAMLEIEDRLGLVFQRIDGVSMAEDLLHHPLRFRSHALLAAQYLAELHTRIFHYDLPDQRTVWRAKIEQSGLPDNQLVQLIERLEALPQGSRLCHGDFHPANLLITPQGLVIIDWLDATVGNPLADLARSTLLIQAAVKNGSLRQPWLRWSVQLFQWILVREYFRLNPGGEKEFRRWLPLAAAARLSEHVPGEHDWLQTQVANSLLLA